jgi:uncharacterized protein (DUF58 family)
VVPAVLPLPAVSLTGAWHAGGDSVARAVAVRGEDDAATREYRHGDDLRKVHWRSTARAGKLMVRREERPWQSTATLLLDSRAAAHHGHGSGSSFEWAVSAVASIGVHLARLGYTLRLLTDAGPVQPGVDFAHEGVLLDQLAEARFHHRTDLRGAVTALRGGEGGHGTLVAVLGTTSLADAQALVTARTVQDLSIAILLDTPTWAGRLRQAISGGDDPDRDQVAELMLRNGWRVIRAEHGSLLPDLWPRAGERAGMPALLSMRTEQGVPS